ncbi:MAG: hypothetical protein DI536_04285 [Archangium gephyra]|uniref:Uncharacterized protein n=1 Tax=Archangium gephyra TaxID=48 RepID=A0A2W5V7W7_9BACT|nr:MAG: hypothetical protein DI536_04285 [Archangium gephyra]
MLLLLLLAQMPAMPGQPMGPIVSSPATSRVSYAFFEFAPANGAGMGSACAGITPTGAKGEALIFARSTTAMCSKRGLRTTGIQPGDLVVVAAGQPRVEPDADGVLGLRLENARANRLLRSSEIDNGAWTKAGGASVSADYALAPDGTMSADRLIYNATSSYVLQADNTGGVATAASVYLRGTSGSGVIDFCHGGGSGQCTTCSYVASSWTRCEFVSSFAAANNVFLGCDAPTKGSACSPAGDVLVWGLQHELGSNASSHIPTVSATANRNVETASFAFTTPLPSGSMAVSVDTSTTSHNGDQGWLVVCGGTTTGFNGLLGYSTAFASSLFINSSTLSGTVGGSVGQSRRAGWWGTSGYGAINTPGTSATGATTTTMTGAPSFLGLGDYNACAAPGSRVADGIYSRPCVDPDPARCR